MHIGDIETNQSPTFLAFERFKFSIEWIALFALYFRITILTERSNNKMLGSGYNSMTCDCGMHGRPSEMRITSGKMIVFVKRYIAANVKKQAEVCPTKIHFS